MKENKICIYAICKNESKFVDKWLESMAEADYIVVLDTGSEDDTYEKLKNDSRVYRCEQKIISPWRFDVARNESLKLVPEDANILFCTDLDEILEPGWSKILKERWIDNVHTRGYYKYAWSHDDSGNPARIFYYDKIHNRDYIWEAPVHEFLYSGKEENILDLFNENIFLHHYPDVTKSRGNYLPLLKLRTEEKPEDYYGHCYLSHEYYYRGFYQEAIEEINYIKKNFNSEMSALEKASAYLFMGDSYKELNKIEEASSCYEKAILEDKSYREPYLALAELMNGKQQYYIAIGIIKQAINNTYRHFSWLERDASWKEAVDDILSISYYYIGDKEKSLYHASKAYNINPKDERIKNNKDLILETIAD